MVSETSSTRPVVPVPVPVPAVDGLCAGVGDCACDRGAEGCGGVGLGATGAGAGLGAGLGPSCRVLTETSTP